MNVMRVQDQTPRIRIAGLKEGVNVRLDGQPMVVRQVMENQVILEDCESKEWHTPRCTDLVIKLNKGEFHVLISDSDDNLEAAINDNLGKDLSVFPEAHQMEVFRRLEYVRAVMRQMPEHMNDGRIREIAEVIAKKRQEKQPSARTIRKWVERYKGSGMNPVSLVPLHDQRGRKKAVSQKTLLELAFERMYDNSNWPHFKDFKEYYEELVKEWNQDVQVSRENWEKIGQEFEDDIELVKPLSESSLRKEFAKRDPLYTATRMFGQEEVDARYKAVFGYPRPSRPMEILQVDHTRADVMALVPGSTKPFRPYVTVIMDVYSRMIVGFYFGLEPYGYIPVMKALRNMLSNKKWLNERVFEVEGSFPAFGVGELIVMDNAKEFRGNSMRSTVVALGMMGEFSEIGTPKQKPHVERFFRTLNTGLFHRLHGATADFMKKIKGYDPEKAAKHTFIEVHDMFVRFIANEYHRRKHRGIGVSPIEKWNKGMEESFFQVPPMSDIEIMQATAIPIFSDKTGDMKAVHHYGIEWEHMKYNSDRLARLLARYDGKLKVRAKYEPDNLSFLWVLDPDTGEWFQVPASTNYVDYTRALTKFQHDIIISKCEKPCAPDTLLDKKAELTDVIKEAAQVGNANTIRAPLFMGMRGAAAFSEPEPSPAYDAYVQNEWLDNPDDDADESKADVQEDVSQKVCEALNVKTSLDDEDLDDDLDAHAESLGD